MEGTLEEWVGKKDGYGGQCSGEIGGGNLYQYLKLIIQKIGLVNAMQGNGPQAKFVLAVVPMSSPIPHTTPV